MANLVLLLGYGLVFLLVRADMRWRRLSSSALWIPAFFFASQGTRSLSFWIGAQSTSNLEGNSVNVLANGTLIVVSITVLARRNFNLAAFIQNNKALVFLYLYFALSAIWSPFPISSLKRVINDSICPLVALIVLTEPDPGAALRIVYTRVGYLLIPMSVVAIRYFPDVGRIFTKGGEPMVTGLAGHKNSLGELMMILGLVMLWDLKETAAGPPEPRAKLQKWSRPVVFLICMYLLYLSQSATSFVCFFLGCVVLFGSKRLAGMSNARQILMVGGAIGIMFFTLNKAFDLTGILLDALGRNRELTGRTEIWQTIFERPINPLLGSGFRGFWETESGGSVSETLEMTRLLTAHNGYIETYLNGGLIAVALLLIMLASMGLTATDKLLKGDLFGRMSLAFFLVTVVHNWSETGYFLGTPLWITLLIMTIDQPRARPGSARIDSPTESDTVVA